MRSIEEEIYTHEYLWRSASALLVSAENEEHLSYRFLLPSLLMSFMAFEAFVNFAGFALLPELWADEKIHFKGKGIDGKIELITTKIPSFQFKKGEALYQRIKSLENFRDAVSHGKVLATQYLVEHKSDGSHFRFNHVWDKYLSIGAVNAARADIKEFCQSVTVAARKTSDHHLHFHFDAFDGSLASGSGRPHDG